MGMSALEGRNFRVGKVQRSRSGKACEHCHARKIRCDVQQRGVPCSNCAAQSESCAVRRRKNARVEEAEGHKPRRQSSVQSGGRSPNGNFQEAHQNHDNLTTIETHTILSEPQLDVSAQPVDWRPFQDNGTWNNSIGAQSLVIGTDQTPSTVDFSYLNDIEDVFAFTDWQLLPGVQQPNSQPIIALPSSQSDSYSPAVSNLPSIDDFKRVGFSGSHAPNVVDQQFLRSQGCFSLPPIQILRQILGYYFQYVHPNLPIIDEYRFAPIWTQTEYRLEGFSFLVFRAILFAAIHFVDLDSLTALGYSGKLEARSDYLRQAKLVFDFGLETDPAATAQGCLLLTYYAPAYNKLRVNSSWLLNAARFARLAQADAFHLVQDPVRRKTLKRLWWCILFRDRILSLGLRWTLQVELDPRFELSEYFLNADDFQPDLGKSNVHTRESQLRIADIVASLCNLVCELTPALQLLYGRERAKERVADISNSIQTNVEDVQSCLDGLQRWHERAILTFPEPISLDDTQDSICIYANLLFCYHSSAVFALNLHRILVHATIPGSRDIISLETSQEASILAINDIGKRMQELVQTRLAQYLPISASAYIALPLLLQAVDVAAVRGTELEAVETRKLDVFSRVLRSQEQNFDGSAFCREILSNIVAYVSNEQSFSDWIAPWRDERGSNGYSATADQRGKSSKKVKLGWANLILKRPQLYLRLLLNLDFALCTGSAPQEEDLIPQLLNTQSR